jgi:hypothetical protein
MMSVRSCTLAALLEVTSAICLKGLGIKAIKTGLAGLELQRISVRRFDESQRRFGTKQRAVAVQDE